MVKEDRYGSSETGNWNVASRFAEVKIMVPLEKCDFYEDVAKFGYHSYLEELMNYGIPTDILKLTALDRLVNELMKIADNSMFAMKKAGTKKQMKNIKERLEDVMKVFPTLATEKRDNIRKTSSVKIDEEIFKEVLKVVLKIKSEINEPLNKNDLIFTDTYEFDPKAAKEQIKSGLIETG